MEERGPPSTSIQVSGDYPNHHFHQNLQDVRPGTYVVQVPKDRIYRTPPPENALIAERHRNAPSKKPSGFPLKCVLISIIIFVLFLGLIGGIILAVIKKDDPRFRVKRVRVTTKGKTRQQKHEFDITLASRNPNAYTIIAFDDHGKTSLSFKDKKFANGNFPSSQQDPKNSKDVKLTLTSSSKTKLPTEIQKSMNETVKSKKHVDILLEFRVPVKMKVGTLEMKSKTISMLCHFKPWLQPLDGGSVAIAAVT
ncbi:NDR1/HIN1-like protein 13 [Cynara cardunculus var. scolymus]|uniref:NDR1/HIN1-like protein 13 n=1 Tax=Cynara cardunculus var. scolymus TaxID=59895 RepID=UPI000D626066|nr:NDR1/HIN1-like protein 13 [Cynara cardunculus var. scolymus]